MKIPRPQSLEGVFHYHNPPNFQPRPRATPQARERVEVMTGGRGWVESGGEWREVLAGDILWHRAGDFTIGKSDPADPYHCLAVTFVVRPARVPRIPRFSHWPAVDEIQNLAREAVRLFLDESFDRDLLCDYLFSRLLFQVRLDQQRAQHQQLPDPVQRVLQLLERDYAESLDIPHLARVAGWSTAHLQECFRAGVGTTPHRWIINRRLRAVRERLLSTPESVKRIAVECGFADSASLAHAFRARFGISPRAFRERYLRAARR